MALTGISTDLMPDDEINRRMQASLNRPMAPQLQSPSLQVQQPQQAPQIKSVPTTARDAYANAQAPQLHGAKKVLDVMGDIFAPEAEQMIPGTPGHFYAHDLPALQQKATQEEKQAEGIPKAEQAGASAELSQARAAAVPQQVEQGAAKVAQGEEKIRQAPELLAQKGEQATQLQTQKGQQQTDLQNQKGQQSAAAQTARGNTQMDIARMRNETARLLGEERNKIAAQNAAVKNDPNALTNTMKTMKQTAQATLPELDNALAETQQVKNMLGPAAGRWNDFMQGKIGASDPKFAHYRDEINFVSTAVTLAHARGRMSNELFQHFQAMFDAGKQSADNMTEALNVAKEWLTGYANLGETPAPGGGGPAAPKSGTSGISIKRDASGRIVGIE